jgi:hypothetical protein
LIGTGLIASHLRRLSVRAMAASSLLDDGSGIAIFLAP